MWSGRFAGTQDPFFVEFQSSARFDWRLILEDLEGSVAWAKALGRAGVLTTAEVGKLTEALEALSRELGEDATPAAETDEEDVHSFVEARLRERVGDLARKLHTGRSRNDQVATDLKLYVRTELAHLRHECEHLMQALLDLAERYAEAPIPGYTHLQRAQPITIGHHVLAYVEMIGRDFTRFVDAEQRLDTCPLGSGALAGTAFAIDREQLARDLDFAGGPTRNSLDAVSDRDHVCETAFACSMVLTHLSRLAEDWIFFASSEARFLQLTDAVCTGSSLMPQKKNPDGLELIRGKAGRVHGHLLGLLTTLKSQPLAYNKDLQEDKEALIDAVDTTLACLQVMHLIVRNASFDTERCAQEAGRGYLNATDLADLLVRKGVPFRTAHERVGAAVRAAMELGVELEQLPSDKRRELLPELDEDLARSLSVAAVLARRDVIGGTAPKRVRQEIQRWRKRVQP
ncbi:MAG: argininosuccinate lyase [Planctomycetes bacterium]|nr:argininosuccinate lyase [Planctomycetota bacterium]